MNGFKRFFVWFYMLGKRLLHQWSFILLLCLIPVGALFTNMAMSGGDSGIVHILLVNEAKDDRAAKIINSLLNDEGVILFSESSSVRLAKTAVENHEADAAWIFPENFTENMDSYFTHKRTKPFINILERENSIPLRIAREKLFSAMYSDISYALYKNFTYSALVSEEQVPEDVLQKYYYNLQKNGSIISIERIGEEKTQRSADYLTAPVRGILSLMVVLCTCAAAMYFLKEQSEGKFAWLSFRKRLMPAFASCLSAACISAIAVFLALWFSGISLGLVPELISMLLFAIATAGFCTTLSLFFRSAGKFGAVIPGLIIIMLVLSPIFFNFKILRPLRLLLPTYYYLQSVYNTKYYLYTAIYCLAVYTSGLLINYLFAERKHKNSIV